MKTIWGSRDPSQASIEQIYSEHPTRKFRVMIPGNRFADTITFGLSESIASCRHLCTGKFEVTKDFSDIIVAWFATKTDAIKFYLIWA